MDKKVENREYKHGYIHFVLAHVYAVFFIALIIGVLIDSILNVNFLKNFNCSYLGIILIILGTILIFWAQNSSRLVDKSRIEEIDESGFAIGPYKYFKHPTYLGLFVTSLGFGILIKSIVSIVFILIAYILIRFVFVRKEENILERKYGEKYTNYKKKRNL